MRDKSKVNMEDFELLKVLGTGGELLFYCPYCIRGFPVM